MNNSEQQRVLKYLNIYLDKHPEKRNQFKKIMETNQPATTTTEIAAVAAEPENVAPEEQALQVPEEKPCYTEEEFLVELIENDGLYGKTAYAIRRNYGIPYTRQAARERAKNYYKIKEDIASDVIDQAKEAIINAIQQDSDKKLKYRAASFLLGTFKKYHNPFTN